MSAFLLVCAIISALVTIPICVAIVRRDRPRRTPVADLPERERCIAIVRTAVAVCRESGELVAAGILEGVERMVADSRVVLIDGKVRRT